MDTSDSTPAGFVLSEAQWERIKDLLPGRAGQRGRHARDNRLFVEALLYRQSVGSSWRKLPAHFGDFRALQIRYSRWQKSGVWQRVLEALNPVPLCSSRPLDLRLLGGSSAHIAIPPSPQQPRQPLPHHRCFPMVSALIIGCSGS